MEEYDASLPKYSFKIVLLGDGAVGKSSILTRLQLDRFDPISLNTIGVDFSIHRMKIGPEIVQLNLWDTAGGERYKSLTKQYYRNADAAVIVYDLTSEETFRSVKSHWINAFYEAVGSDKFIMFVGNKSDLVRERDVDSNQIEQLVSLYCCSSWETSAKEATNVFEAFHDMAANLVENTKQLQSITCGPESLSLPYDIDSYEVKSTNCCWSS